mmetsp:Transcript_47879/g.110964  ORF Transcript_47879/g.110964 Transcript_47879/m.110964 type:complete len:232 (+) Transcript_47879:22-717(+)
MPENCTMVVPPKAQQRCGRRRTTATGVVAGLLVVSAAVLLGAPIAPLAWVAARAASAQEVDAVAERPPPAIRIGHGWDIHRLSTKEEAGQGCVIGGVEVDCDLGVVAHSDGDVLYHSATDAILGALSLPDIGQLFPDNDPQWRGAASEKFLDVAWKLMDERGYRIANLDATLVLQKPRVAPIKEAMKENLSRLLRVPLPYVNVKARTHEKVDSIGEGRALSCHVVVLLERQ